MVLVTMLVTERIGDRRVRALFASTFGVCRRHRLGACYCCACEDLARDGRYARDGVHFGVGLGDCLSAIPGARIGTRIGAHLGSTRHGARDCHGL
jgi:hypothetical protein